MLTHKLETEQSLLIPKSRAALSRYGHQLVIGNDLHRRKFEVVFVERLVQVHGPSTNSSAAGAPRKAQANGALTGAQTPPLKAEDLPESEVFTEKWLRLEDVEAGVKEDVEAEEEGGREREGKEREIEELIIGELVQRHTKWIEHA